jgi:aryl-alcohol dehydrogenase-like predicted oxidoreductase
VLDALHAVAEESGRSPAQVAIRWLLQQPGVTAPIVGVRTLSQLEANLGALGWTLEEGQLERLNRASALQPPYPHDFIAQVVGNR